MRGPPGRNSAVSSNETGRRTGTIWPQRPSPGVKIRQSIQRVGKVEQVEECRTEIWYGMGKNPMPRNRVNPGCSNLSLVIPRSVHRAARIRALRAGAPSLASYVAMVLDQAPESLTAEQVLATHVMELRLKACRQKVNQ